MTTRLTFPSLTLKSGGERRAPVGWIILIQNVKANRVRVSCKRTMEKLKRCTKCFGRGFHLKIGGYTVADRVTCNKCGGSGQIKEDPNEPKKKYAYKYRYRGKNGVSIA